MSILSSLVAYAGPAWIINVSFSFLNPLVHMFPSLRRFDIATDGGRHWSDGRRILGESQRTLKWFVVFLLPILLVFVFRQSYLILLLKAVCVSVGDTAGSFIKRRAGLARGVFLPGVDHGDYMLVLGTVFLFFRLESLFIVVLSLLVTYIFHPFVCVAGYQMKIKENPL